MPVYEGELINPFLTFTWMFHPELALPLVKALLVTDMFRIIVFPGFGFAALLAATVIFIERKMLAKLQLRVGPFYCGKIEGILQLMGDGLKLISKEIIIPAKADKPIFILSPLLFLGAAAAFVALIPVAPGWVVADIDLGLIAVFAVIGFFPIITVLAAWLMCISSYNNCSIDKSMPGPFGVDILSIIRHRAAVERLGCTFE